MEGSIPPPWQTLYDIRDGAVRLEERLQEWLNTVSEVEGFPVSVVEELKRKAKLLLNKAKKLIKFGDKNVENSFAVKNEAHRLLDEIIRLQKDTNDVVQGLKNYGQVGAGEVSVENALREAQHLASEIRRRNGTINSMKIAAMNALRKSEDILDRIRKLLEGGPEVGPLRQGLEMLTSRLDSLLESLHGTSEVLAKTKSLTNHNKEILKSTKMNIDQILDFEGEVEILSDEAKILVENARSFLENATTNMRILEDNMRSFANLTQQVKEKEGILYRINPIYHDQYVLKAQQHADLLYERAQQYRDLFNSTRKEADFALRASRAYQGIVDAINTAKESAMNASFAGDIAFKTAYPGSIETSVLKLSRDVGEKSDTLLKKAEEELLRVNNVKDDYANAKAKINGVRDTIMNAEHGNKRVLQELKKLNSGEIQKYAAEAMMRAESALKLSRQTNATAARVSSDVKSKLRPLLATLSEDDLIASHTEKLIAAQKNIAKIKELLEKMNQRSNDEKQNFNKWNNTMASKLQELRSKITQARHTAEGQEFMALEMVNRTIRFVWNAGGGVGVVVHPQKIEKAVLREDKNWYRIQVERTSNIARLSVRQQILPEGSPHASGDPVSNSSKPGFGIVDVRPGDRLWIGGLPPGATAPPQLLAPSKGLAGCLHRIMLDGRPIGLWNFATETKNSCTACIAGVEETRDESAYHFAGDGYSMHTVNSYDISDKYQFSITLKFKTLDENAILFIAVDKHRTRFIALLLENGYLVFHIGYGRKIGLQLKTITKVNTGTWVSCEAVRVFEVERRLESALLSIDGESKQSSPSEPPTTDDIPELEEYFLGGVPPGFLLNTNLLVLPPHFLGCMSDIQLFSGGVNPLSGKFYGVEASCTVSYTTVSFRGRGFLELPPHPLKKKESSFEFVFRSRQKDALLMLTKGYEKGDYYSVALHSGKVVVWVSNGDTRTIHQSKKQFNDGQFHSLSVTKKNRKLTLRIDEEDHGTFVMQASDYQVRVASPSDPRKVRKGGLFFGGDPTEVPNEPEAASYISLVGTIKHAIFNNQSLRFEDQVSFHHADIGRLGPWELGETREISFKPPAPTLPTQCHKVSHYAVEPHAVKFGDSPESYVRMTRRANPLQKNFTIEFSFRTYYPNGLLFIVPVQRKKESHFMIALHNKHLYVELKGRKKVNKIIGQSELNDGMWHNVLLKRVIVRCDSGDGKPVQVEQNFQSKYTLCDNKWHTIHATFLTSGLFLKVDNLPNVTGLSYNGAAVISHTGSSLYIGGVPENSTGGTLITREYFKGCIRNIVIGRQRKDWTDMTVLENVHLNSCPISD
ncbi:Laminin subunit alpha [Gryllus bimaculatus]|nr:Laminin subunit alpha [Gryllus bimaculatus]